MMTRIPRAQVCADPCDSSRLGVVPALNIDTPVVHAQWADGAAGGKTVVVEGVRNVAQGLATLPDGAPLIPCCEPSRI